MAPPHELTWEAPLPPSPHHPSLAVSGHPPLTPSHTCCSTGKWGDTPGFCGGRCCRWLSRLGLGLRLGVALRLGVEEGVQTEEGPEAGAAGGMGAGGGEGPRAGVRVRVGSGGGPGAGVAMGVATGEGPRAGVVMGEGPRAGVVMGVAAGERPRPGVATGDGSGRVCVGGSALRCAGAAGAGGSRGAAGADGPATACAGGGGRGAASDCGAVDAWRSSSGIHFRLMAKILSRSERQHSSSSILWFVLCSSESCTTRWWQSGFRTVIDA